MATIVVSPSWEAPANRCPSSACLIRGAATWRELLFVARMENGGLEGSNAWREVATYDC